jgi:hypothetical protein
MRRASGALAGAALSTQAVEIKDNYECRDCQYQQSYQQLATPPERPVNSR